MKSSDAGQKTIDIVKLLPETLPSGKKIFWEKFDESRIRIFVDKHSARGGNPKDVIIKRFIPVNELLFEGLGLRFGDGDKIQGGNLNVFGFANTELELHKNFLKFAKENLGLNSYKFHIKLSIPPDMISNLDNIQHKIHEELKIPFENFWKPKIFEKRNLPFVDVKIQSKLLGLLINSIFYEVEKLLFQNQKFTINFLQGVIASEANVHVRSDSGRLGEISIAAEGEDKRFFIRQLLMSLRIQPSKDKTIEHQESVLIHGLSNFKKVKEFNLCSLHPQKSNAFEIGMNGFKIEQSRKGELRLKVLQLLAEKEQTRQELGKLLHRSPATVKTEALYVLEKQGLVERGKINNKARLWKITTNGLKILKDQYALEKLRNR